MHGCLVEWSSFKQCLIQKFDFLLADSGIFGKLSKWLAVSIQLRQIHHILINFVERFSLRSSRKQHTGITSLNSIFWARRFIVWSTLNFFNVTESKRLEKFFVKI
jgi:hypothetical protein